MRIAFDVDNVLADSMTCWCRKASEKLGKTVTREQIKSHKIVGSIKISYYEIIKLQDEVWEEWKDLPLTEEDLSGKLDAFRHNGFQVLVVTSRPLRSSNLVRNWLSNNNIPYDEFHSIGPYRSKSEIDADALVDDAPEHIQDFVQHGRTGFLYAQPWNRNVRIEKAIDVKTIGEVLEYYGLPKAEPR